jgi:hypothetical protein
MEPALAGARDDRSAAWQGPWSRSWYHASDSNGLGEAPVAFVPRRTTGGHPSRVQRAQFVPAWQTRTAREGDPPRPLRGRLPKPRAEPHVRQPQRAPEQGWGAGAAGGDAATGLAWPSLITFSGVTPDDSDGPKRIDVEPHPVPATRRDLFAKGQGAHAPCPLAATHADAQNDRTARTLYVADLSALNQEPPSQPSKRWPAAANIKPR